MRINTLTKRIFFDGDDNLNIRGGLLVVEGNAIQLTEQTAPAAPAANKVRIYAVDSGGKTALMALFPSGAAQQLSIEP
jgi:hypothetical protein